MHLSTSDLVYHTADSATGNGRIQDRCQVADACKVQLQVYEAQIGQSTEARAWGDDARGGIEVSETCAKIQAVESRCTLDCTISPIQARLVGAL